MAKLPVGLHKRPNSSTYQQRVVLPLDLRHLYPGEGGKPRAFIRVSLGTRDLADAKRKSMAVMAEWGLKFDQQRAVLNPHTVASLTPALVDAVCAHVRRDILQSDDNLRSQYSALLSFLHETGPKPTPGIPWVTPDYMTPSSDSEVTPSQLRRLRHLEDLMVRGLQEELAYSRTTLGKRYAARALGAMGLSAKLDDPSNRAAMLRITRAVVQGWADAARRSHGEAVETPPAVPVAPEVLESATVGAIEAPKSGRPRTAHGLEDVVTSWSVGKSTDAISKATRAVALVTEAGLSTALADMSKTSAKAFRAWLIQVGQPWGATTATKHFQQVQTLLNFAANELEWIAASPWTGVAAPTGRKAQRTPWSKEDLAKLTAHPIYQRFELNDDRRAGGPAQYWLPLLAMYSGCRLAELCQLTVDDVVTRDGVLLLNINDQDGKAVKSDAGIRLVPVHAELVRLGFDAMVTHRRTDGHTNLWDLYEQPSRTAEVYFSDFFRDLRKSLGLDARWQDFHAFRTTVSTALRGVHPALSETLIDAVLGHESGGRSVGATNYTKHGPEARARAIAALDYNLDLPRVYKGQA